jgi:hypothetical protein
MSTPIPATAAHRPTIGGAVIPYINVRLADGGVDFRSHHTARSTACYTGQRCQLCGNPLRQPIVFLASADALRALQFDEPPLHPECARYVTKVCPVVAGRRTHHAAGPPLAARHRGQTCPEPDCDCGGWVQKPDAYDGPPRPALPWFAVYVNHYEPASYTDTPDVVTAAICTPADVLKVMQVSAPGEGGMWLRVADPTADYVPPVTTTGGAR